MKNTGDKPYDLTIVIEEFSVGVKVVWDENEKHIMRYIFAGDWNWGDVHSAIATSNAWLDAEERKIPFIIDLRKSSDKSADKSLGNVRRLINNTHPNTGLVVITGYGQSTVIQLTKSILAMVDRIGGPKRPFYFADTLEEARELIANKVDFA